jgi:cytochrome c-type biogenesis protein CcmH
MIAFWFIAATLVCVGLLLVVPALFRRSEADAAERREQNIDIARERLAALEAEAAVGSITESECKQRRTEIEEALYNDLAASPQAKDEKHAPAAASRWTAAALIIVVPMLAGALYFHLGNQKALTAATAPSANDSTPAERLSVQEMVDRLAARLQKQPEDAKGWLMLGRSYMVMKRYREAADAFDRVHALVGDNPAVLLLSAEALAMSNGGRFAGRPDQLIKKALVLNANEPMALWLGGMAASQRGDDKAALEYWRQLRPIVEKDSAAAAQLAALIDQAEQRLGVAGKSDAAAQTTTGKQPSSDPSYALSVKVHLAPRWADQVAPTATLFVYARAVTGPPMPLAIVRKQVKDLPLEVTLTDAMAMTPKMKLSNFPNVQVIARISESGQAMPRTGDLQGVVPSVAVGRAEPVEIIINEKVP